MITVKRHQLSAAAAINTVAEMLVGVAIAYALASVGFAQATVVTPATANYLNPGHVPAPVRGLLANFGDRITRPGNERTTLIGTYSLGGAPIPMTITWEVPGRLRFDRSDQAKTPLVYDEVSGVANGNSLSETDASMLETLLDDCPQTFFYLIHQGTGHRYLGSWFRADGGTSKSYVGPWYDIYDVYPPDAPQAGVAKRTKRYRFDSTTQLLASVEYFTGPTQRVTTEYSEWTKVNGEAFPAKIVRTDGNKVVLTFNLTSAKVGPSANDGKFPGH